MSRAIETYLDRVIAYSNRKGEEARAVRDELRDHLLEKVERLKVQGTPAEDAVFIAIEENGQPHVVGYGLREKFPLLDVRAHGIARGFIAVGPKAVGVFAFGGVAVGVFAFGGVSLGVIGMGGVVGALLFAWGGLGVVPLGVAFCGLAVGLVAIGGFALGAVATGGAAIGLWAQGGFTASYYNHETVPGALKWIGPWMPNDIEMLYLSVAMIALYIPILIVNLKVSLNEQRRLRQADPSLAV